MTHIVLKFLLDVLFRLCIIFRCILSGLMNTFFIFFSTSNENLLYQLLIATQKVILRIAFEKKVQ